MGIYKDLTIRNARRFPAPLLQISTFSNEVNLRQKVLTIRNEEGTGQASDTAPAPSTDSISLMSLSIGFTRISRPTEIRDSFRVGFWRRK